MADWIRKDDVRACEAEAVVVDIRSNGVVVFLPSLGVKASICCRDKAGLSIFAAAFLDPSLRDATEKATHLVTGGPCVVHDDRIELSTSSGRSVVFRRFDHLLVRIGIMQSRYRLNQYSLSIVGLWTRSQSKESAQ